MNVNNFDTSSTGTNLELSCFMDGINARERFEENFITLRQGSRSVDPLYLYTMGNNSTVRFVETDPRNYDFTGVSVKDLVVKYIKRFSSLAEPDISDVKMAYDELRIYGEKVRNMEMATFLERLHDALGGKPFDLYSMLASWDVNSKFRVMNFTGYSQGDYAIVLVPREVLTDYFFFDAILTTQERMNVCQDIRATIDRLLWQTPAYCELKINGDEVFFTEIGCSEYDWDKTFVKVKYLEHLKEKRISAEKIEQISAFLEANLPAQPDYVG